MWPFKKAPKIVNKCIICGTKSVTGGARIMSQCEGMDTEFFMCQKCTDKYLESENEQRPI